MNEERFTGKAEDYTKFRPNYPKEIIALLQKECGLSQGSVVADIGAGTGIFTQLISDYCKTVFAVEPNADMINQVIKKDNIIPIQANAENTLIESNSIDIITAAQAFHWFDKKAAKQEFKRILKNGGHVALIWNNRNKNSPFEKAYEAICDRYRDKYLKDNDKRDSENDKAEFYGGKFNKFCFPNIQQLNLEQVIGRLLSLSYIPKRQDAEFAKIESEVREQFVLYSKDNKIKLTMNTEVYIGKI